MGYLSRQRFVQASTASFSSDRSVLLSPGRPLHSSTPRAHGTFSTHCRSDVSARVVSASKLDRRVVVAAVVVAVVVVVVGGGDGIIGGSPVGVECVVAAPSS